jgi:hypothetical protein
VYIPSWDEMATVAHSQGQLSEWPEAWLSLFGWWPMQEGGGAVARDMSGRQNHLVLTGLGSTVLWDSGEHGNCLDFTGSTGLARVLLNETVGRPLTLMWIVSVDDWTWRDCGGLTDADTEAGNQDSATLHFDGSADQGGVTGQNASDERSLTFSGGGASYYVVLWTCTEDDPGVIRLWVNGLMASEELQWGRGPAASDRVRLGDAEIWNSNGFDGRIASFAVWNRVLSPSEIVRVSADPWALGRMRSIGAVAYVASATYDTIHNLSPTPAANDTWEVAP